MVQSLDVNIGRVLRALDASGLADNTIVVFTSDNGGERSRIRLFQQQAQERDRKKREALLHRIQRLMHERVMFGPIFEPAILHGVGPRVEEPAIGLSSQL